MSQNVIVSERLPFKFGNYCDAFIGFHRDLGTELTFCSCQRDAIQKHVEICRIHEEATKNRERLGWYMTWPADYPGALWKEASFPFSERVPFKVLPQLMRFADGICHRCNQRLPYYPYPDSPAGFFISHFRPYVNQACYGAGMTPRGHIVLADACPEWIAALDEKVRVDAIEAQVRRAFGFPPKGVNRNQESKLWLLIRQALPECSVVRHYRPPWLEGLELDIFIEQHNLGIEFQGKQHSEAFDYLGGERALKQTRSRDKKKARLCKQLGVTLLLFEEGEALSEDAVHAKLREVIPSVGIPPRVRHERAPYGFFVPVEGSTLRFTYHDEKNELSVSGEIGGADFYAAGSSFSLLAYCEGERVKSLEFVVRERAKCFKVTFPLAAGEGAQFVEMGNNTQRPLLDFFKVWSMFNPRVRVRDYQPASDSKWPRFVSFS